MKTSLYCQNDIEQKSLHNYFLILNQVREPCSEIAGPAKYLVPIQSIPATDTTDWHSRHTGTPGAAVTSYLHQYISSKLFNNIIHLSAEHNS